MILNYNDDIVKNLKVSGKSIKLSFLKIRKKSPKAPDLDENRENIKRTLKESNPKGLFFYLRKLNYLF